MKLVKGKRYNLLLDEALIETEYTDTTQLGNKRMENFACVKTRKVYHIPREQVETLISAIAIKATDGVKHDIGKLRYDLMVWEFVEGITAVLTYGAHKYVSHNWKYVKGRRWRYFGALMRHLIAWWNAAVKNNAELKLDPDTKLSHLYHAGCCLAFLAWCDLNPAEEDMEE